MKPSKMSLYEVFERQRVYTVPLYQRPYVWSLQKHWAPLWRDIKDKAVAVRDNHTAKPHFFGAVVFEQVQVFGKQLFNASIIDGQQRLTTSQVFLAAFRDLVQALGYGGLHEELVALTTNRGTRESPYEKFKVWPTNVDRPAFEAVMTNGSPEALLKAYPFRQVRRTKRFEPRPPLVEAYEFFHKSLRLLDAEDPSAGQAAEASEASLNAVYEVVKQHLQLVVIDLEKDDDPQVIFESLNGRSEALLPSDLIRNFVFLQAKTKNEPADELYKAFWQEFDEKSDPDSDSKSGEAFWRKVQTVGRVPRRRLDLFFEHYLEYRTGNDVNLGLLFSEFRDWWLKKGSTSVHDELKALRAHSDVYAGFLQPNAQTRLGEFAERLITLDTTTIYPLLLHLLAGTDGTPDGDDLAGVLTDLDSYLVRRMICGHTTAAYNHIFLKLVQRLQAGEAGSTRQVIRDYLLAGKGPSDRWPDDDELARVWMEEPAYKTVKPGRVLMVLSAIERHLRTDKQETKTPPGTLSVEHVLPQKWVANWPLPGELTPADREAATARRNTLLHAFGNLTLVTQPLNSALSNGPFAGKQQEITSQSLLRLNAYFQKRTHWDETLILERGLALLEVAKAVWPHPGRPPVAAAEVDVPAVQS